MKRFLIFSLFLTSVAIAKPGQHILHKSGTAVIPTGGLDLSEDTYTTVIDMCGSDYAFQIGDCYTHIDYKLTVTAGTSTSFTFSCETSSLNDSDFLPIWRWNGSTLTPVGPAYDLSLGTKVVAGVDMTERYIKCSASDAVDGTGTIPTGTATLSK